MVDSARGGAVRAFGPRVSQGADTDSHEEAGHGGDHDRTLSVLSESHLSVVHAAATRPGLWANSAWLVGLLIPTLVLMSYGVIAREERYMAQKFGDEYLRYRASVRRWI